MPGETRGLLGHRDSWTTLTRAQVAFGQGLSVNALQMATAVNTIANGGELVTPSLVEGQATTASGEEVGTETATRRRVVSAAAARKTAEMMEMVTTQDVGTAPGAGIEGYRVAGKTGTAQEVGGACNCYRDGGLDVSFAGLRAGRQAALHRLRRDQAPRRGRQRWWHRRPGVPQDPQLRPAEVRRAADRHAARHGFPPSGGPHGAWIASGGRPS